MTALILVLHVLAVVIAFGILVFPGLLFERIAEKGDVRTIRNVFGIGVARVKFGAPLLILGALLGVWLAYSAGYSLSAGWLVASYLSFIALVAIGIGYHSRWERHVYGLAMASPENQPSADLQAAIEKRSKSPLGYVSLLLFIFIMYLMSAKPF